MAIAILATLLGYTVAIKIYAVFKAFGIEIDNMNQKEIEELLKDKRFRKYMR